MINNSFVKIKKVMEKKQTSIFLLLVFIAGLSFYFGKNQGQKEQVLFSLLRQQYNDNFTAKTFPLGNFLITNAYTNTTFFDDGHLDKKATPRLIVQDLKIPKIESIYEVSFTNNEDENSGNMIYENKVEIKKDLLVAQWTISYGGSGASKGLVVFGNQDGYLKPILGYPFPNDSKSTINLTDKLNNKKYAFPITDDSHFSEVRDLNNDGRPDLLFADWKFEKGQYHYQPRPWNLQVFELVDNKFRIAKWWNKGEVYKTSENIGYNEVDALRLGQIFIEKL